MAKGGRPSGRGKDAAKRSRATTSRNPSKASQPARPAQRRTPTPAPLPDGPPPGPFRLGAIPGATPGRWIDTWNERMPRSPLELIPLAVADQRAALQSDDIDAAIVRLPLDSGDLHVIRLYDELPVVVASVDSHLLAADELDLADLAGEVVIAAADDVLGLAVPGATAPRFAPPESTEEAIATVATGVGVVIVPMSLARLHHRKDVEYRVLRDAPASTVALAWPAERTTALVEAFVGIVRGRTANSSR